ncbi:MAG: PaaI family thioesterase [Candidatus Thorarchaeota archaeon]
MTENDKKIKKRSERMIKLFNAVRGKNVGEVPGPIPPFSKWLNGSIIYVKRGELELEFEIRPEWANPTGLLHGGMQCGLMDDTIGMMTATLGYEGFLITIDFHVDYLGKVKVGEKIRVKGKLVREGRNIIHTASEIYNMDGKLIALGNANLLKTKFTPEYVKAIDSFDEKNL